MSASSDLVSMAARIASEAHKGQFRRDGVTPYIGHPEAVAKRVAGDSIAEAIAWLHDVLEDTTVTAEDLVASGIPVEVVERVVMLTKIEGVKYEDYLSRIKNDPVARRVKIADMLTNLSDSPTDRQIVKYAKGFLILLE